MQALVSTPARPRPAFGVIAAGMAAALAGWAVVRLAGVGLAVQSGPVGPAAVLATALVAGLGAWGVSTLLARAGRARWWPFAGSTALAISVMGPSYQADGAAAVALIGLHFLVALVLILGFTRLTIRRV
jgi:hypothetical protein